MKLTYLDQMSVIAVTHEAGISKQVLFGEHELPASVRLSHACLKPGERVNAHKHLTEVFYVLGGAGELLVDGALYPIRAGAAIRIDSGEMHALHNSGADDLTLLYFGLLAARKAAINAAFPRAMTNCILPGWQQIGISPGFPDNGAG
jgi:quercetin dioxygenase-like cupin family protein